MHPAPAAAAGRGSVWLGECGGVASEGLARVVAEGRAAAAAAAAPTLGQLDEARLEIVQEMRESGLCVDGAVAFANRSLNWMYYRSVKCSRSTTFRSARAAAG